MVALSKFSSVNSLTPPKRNVIIKPNIINFLDLTNIPFFSEDSIRGIVPDSHPVSFGLGYQPLNEAAQNIKEADVVLLLGKKLDYTLGFGGDPPFASNVKQIVIDPSISQIGIGTTKSDPAGELGLKAEEYDTDLNYCQGKIPGIYKHCKKNEPFFQ